MKINYDLYVIAKPNPSFGLVETEGPFVYTVWNTDINDVDKNYILVYTQPGMSLDIPDSIDMVSKAIESFEDAKEKLQAEYHVKKTEIEDKISKLLAIEHKPEKPINSPRQLGIQAYNEGKTSSDNPYIVNTLDHDAWAQGWCDMDIPF